MKLIDILNAQSGVRYGVSEICCLPRYAVFECLLAINYKITSTSPYSFLTVKKVAHAMPATISQIIIKTSFSNKSGSVWYWSFIITFFLAEYYLVQKRGRYILKNLKFIVYVNYRQVR